MSITNEIIAHMETAQLKKGFPFLPQKYYFIFTTPTLSLLVRFKNELVNSILLFHFLSWTLYSYFIKCIFSIVSCSGGLLSAHKLVHRAVEAEGSGKLHEGRGRYEVLREVRYHEEDGDGNEDDGRDCYNHNAASW